MTASIPIVAWAHPRSRGENSDHFVEPFGLWGSSPLTRGKRSPHTRCEGGQGSSPLTRGKRLTGIPEGRADGLIPAHAGKTARSRPQRPRCRAHPRSRGENRADRAFGRDDEGSSPLTRGKHKCPSGASHTQGLIPAHAGKTSSPGASSHPARAHPRSRGENTS